MTALMRIVSGGQTGVDQAALRAAQEIGLSIGGWCPPGRACESGTIPTEFPLQETPIECSPAAPTVPRSQRTEWNVRDSDATLILQPQSRGQPDPGTEWTGQCAARYGRPLFVCDPSDPTAAETVRQWLVALSVKTLNVAGPSEGTVPSIGQQAHSFVLKLLTLATGESPRP